VRRHSGTSSQALNYNHIPRRDKLHKKTSNRKGPGEGKAGCVRRGIKSSILEFFQDKGTGKESKAKGKHYKSGMISVFLYIQIDLIIEVKFKESRCFNHEEPEWHFRKVQQTWST